MTIYLGYARVSTESQNLDLQIDALRSICGDQIWREKKSGMSQNGRSELSAMITEAKRLRSAGEEVAICCYSLSRLGRRLVETVSLIEELHEAGIGFKSVSESIDTSTAMGRCFLNIVASLAQMEAEVLSERTKAGLAARRNAGIKLGPKFKDFSAQLQQAKQLIAIGHSVHSAAKQVQLSDSTLRRQLKTALSA